MKVAFLVGAILLLAAIARGEATTHPTTAPYVEALQLVRELESGPDEALLDREAPLNDRTAAFLARNVRIFSLLHDAAINDLNDWGGAGDMDAMMKQLNGLRALANVGALRARFL